MQDYVTMLLVALWIVVIIGFVIKVVRNKLAPVKTVKAVVIDKNIIEFFSKYAGNGKKKKHAVVFSANGKKLSFYVSEFSYNGYRVNEKGTLKYKGDRLIDFS